MASSRTLGTGELLEMILLQLDNRTLLLAQRVCKCWSSTILDSPALQRKLFFRLEADFRLEAHKKAETALKARKERERHCSPSQGQISHADRPVVELNPLLVDAFPIFFPENIDGSDLGIAHGRGQSFKTLPWNANEKNTIAFARREASWRRMLLHKPCSYDSSISYSQEGSVGSTTRVCTLDDGPRMGLVYDIVQENILELGRFCYSSFDIQWHIPTAETEEDWEIAQKEWENRRIIVEPDWNMVLTVRLRHFYGCVEIRLSC